MKDTATLKWIYKTAKKQIPALIFLTLCNALLAGIGVATALLSRGAVNGAVSRNFKTLVFYGILLFGVILVELVFRILCRLVEAHTMARLEISFIKRIQSKLMKKSYMSVTGFHSGELLNRFTSDVSVITENTTKLIPQMVFMLTRLIFAFGALYVIDKTFALIFAVVGVFVFILSRSFRGLMKSLHKNVQKTTGIVRSFLQEMFENLLVVKTFSIENKMLDKTGTLCENNYKAKMKRASISIYASAGFSFLFSAGYIYSIVWGCWGIYHNVLNVGTLFAVFQLVGQVQSPFTGMSGLLSRYYSTVASSERLIELENLYDEPTCDFIKPFSSYNDFKYFSFEDVAFSYDRESVLEHINTRIEKGELVLVSGISGIGKSTFLKLLLGVLTPSSGEVRVYTENGDYINANIRTRGFFAYVPQGILLLSGTIRENLMLVRDDASEDDLRRAIEISCANDFISLLPEGLDTLIGERGQGLSEGQSQRLAIARAVLSDAPVLLLDEATSALDEVTEMKVLQNIMSMENKTCIFISHKSAARKICERELSIKDKEIIELELSKSN